MGVWEYRVPGCWHHQPPCQWLRQLSHFNSPSYLTAFIHSVTRPLSLPNLHRQIWLTHQNQLQKYSIHHIQQALDGMVATNHQSAILPRAQSTVDMPGCLQQHLQFPHSGKVAACITNNWVGLRQSDEAVRIAVAHRLGCKACEPHTYLWKGSWRTWAAWTLLPQKLSRTTVSQSSEWHDSNQTSADAGSQEAMLNDNKHPDGTTLFPIGKMETHGVGHDSTGHLCRVPHHEQVDHTRCGSPQSSTEDRQVCQPEQ